MPRLFLVSLARVCGIRARGPRLLSDHRNPFDLRARVPRRALVRGERQIAKRGANWVNALSRCAQKALFERAIRVTSLGETPESTSPQMFAP